MHCIKFHFWGILGRPRAASGGLGRPGAALDVLGRPRASSDGHTHAECPRGCFPLISAITLHEKLSFMNLNFSTDPIVNLDICCRDRVRNLLRTVTNYCTRVCWTFLLKCCFISGITWLLIWLLHNQCISRHY